jgi:hypothetical protein
MKMGGEEKAWRRKGVITDCPFLLDVPTRRIAELSAGRLAFCSTHAALPEGCPRFTFKHDAINSSAAEFQNAGRSAGHELNAAAWPASR